MTTYVRHAFEGTGADSGDDVLIDCTGGNLLVIWLYNNSSTTPTAVSVGGSGTGVTLHATSSDGTWRCYYRQSPPSGSQSVAYTLDGNAAASAIKAVLYSDAGTPRTADIDFDEAGPSVTGTPTSQVGDLVISGCAAVGDDLASGSSQTDESINENFLETFRCIGTANKAGEASTTTVSWTGTGAEFLNLIAFAIPSSGATAPTITSLNDTTLTHGQTGVVITGTNFSASGNTVTISPTDNVADVNAVTQPISAQGTTEITLGALDLDSFAFGTLYVFVTNDDEESNADGEAVSRIVASATLDFTGSNHFKDDDGTPQASVSDLTFYVWRSPRPTGAPDQTFTEQATDSSGELSLNLTLGSLDDGDTVFFLGFAPDSTNLYCAGEMLPTYA